MSVLAKHVDAPGRPHRLIALDGARLRCLDCLHTLDLRPGAVPDSTSTSTAPPALHARDRCPQHLGERAGTCGPCRAEQLEADRVLDQQPTADVAAGAAAVRAALAGATRRQPETPMPERLGTSPESGHAPTTWPCCDHCTGSEHPPHRVPCDLCAAAAPVPEAAQA